MNPVRTRIVLASFGICFLGLLMSAMLAPAEAANPKISVAVGQSITQRVPTTIKTVSIANSDVADVVVAGPREILVNGKKVGFTTLVVWDEALPETASGKVQRKQLEEGGAGRPRALAARLR